MGLGSTLASIPHENAGEASEPSVLDERLDVIRDLVVQFLLRSNPDYLVDIVFEMKSTGSEEDISVVNSHLKRLPFHSSPACHFAGLNPAVLKLDWSFVQQKLCWTCFTAEHDAEPKQAQPC